MASVSLEQRIMSAPGHHVKAVLLSVCSDMEVKNHVVSRLDALTQFESAGETNRKRKADDDLAVCVQCEDPFSKDDNPFGSCFYHTGEMEVDYERDFWADHDENCHGRIDSDESRKEYPGGFIWSCCEQICEGSTGCTKGRHETDPYKAFKELEEEQEESEEEQEGLEEDQEDSE